MYNNNAIPLYLSNPILLSFSEPEEIGTTTTVQEPANLAALDLELAEHMLLEPEPTEEDEFLIWNMRKESLEADIELARTDLLSISESQEEESNLQDSMNSQDMNYAEHDSLSDGVAQSTLDKSDVNEEAQSPFGKILHIY